MTDAERYDRIAARVREVISAANAAILAGELIEGDPLLAAIRRLAEVVR
jgi:uncharacterized protein (DUF1786 family)